MESMTMAKIGGMANIVVLRGSLHTNNGETEQYNNRTGPILIFMHIDYSQAMSLQDAPENLVTASSPPSDV